VPPKAPAPATQAAVRRALAKLHRLEAAGRCDVLYGDESGFSLLPCVPYLWQPKAQTLCLPAHPHQKRLNILGFWRSDNHLQHFPLQGRLNAQHFLQSLEALLPTLRRPTVLVLDNASVHRAKVVQAKRREWKAKGLRLLFLPPYSPHLNRIEVLWRQMKYRWLEPDTYCDFPTLCHHVTSLLDQVGSKYRLSFA
jgi:hypothetical protein